MLRNKRTVKYPLYTGLSAIGVVSYVALCSPTLAAIATFDSFSEGFSEPTITDGGITFFDLDERISQEQFTYTFSIESTTEDQLGSFFSAPNYLTTAGFVPGPGLSFGRFGSARITTGEVEEIASLELFSLPFAPSNNILTLEALLEGNVVASNSAALADFEVVGTNPVLHTTLAISGVAFDELRLVASGPDDDGVAFIGIDNVRVGVPEHTSALGILAFGALSAGSVLKRLQKSL